VGRVRVGTHGFTQYKAADKLELDNAQVHRTTRATWAVRMWARKTLRGAAAWNAPMAADMLQSAIRGSRDARLS
jgi:hypothetical protein